MPSFSRIEYIKARAKSKLSLHSILKTYFLDSDREESGEAFLRSTKDRHKGHRGFVIGNGPSLRVSDLSKLSSEITIASNKVYLAFDHTHWRPTYASIADPLVWEKTSATLHNFLPEVIVPSYLDKSKSLSLCHVIKRPAIEKFSVNYLEGFSPGKTVTFFNLQLAVHLGLNPIYIIGCDHFYAGEEHCPGDKSLKITHEKENHFIKGYRDKGELVFSAPIEAMNQNYRMAREVSERCGITIYNATRGGFLDVFPRVSFASVV